jgi:hypothetical protein
MGAASDMQHPFGGSGSFSRTGHASTYCLLGVLPVDMVCLKAVLHLQCIILGSLV